MKYIHKIDQSGYNKETSEKYTAGQHKFFNIEKVEDGATIEMEKEIHTLSMLCPIQTLVDIGCGSNPGYLELWRENSQANTVIGIEPSSYMRDLLYQKITPELKHKIMVSEGSWSNTKMKAATADLVVSRFSLHNIENISEGYKELSRILKSGRYAVISLPHPGYCKKELEEKGIDAVEGTPMEVTVFDAKLHYFYHTLNSYLGENLTRNGLRLVRNKSLNWGAKNSQESDLPNTLLFTIQKII